MPPNATKSTIFFFACVLCASCSDLAVNLSEDYVYRDEGGDTKEIFSERGGREIPATVVAYNYDDDFILARQNPKIPGDPLYSREPDYTLGENYLYFWIVSHAHDSIWGPMSEEEYMRARAVLGVPADLVLPR